MLRHAKLGVVFGHVVLRSFASVQVTLMQIMLVTARTMYELPGTWYLLVLQIGTAASSSIWRLVQQQYLQAGTGAV